MTKRERKYHMEQRFWKAVSRINPTKRAMVEDLAFYGTSIVKTERRQDGKIHVRHVPFGTPEAWDAMGIPPEMNGEPGATSDTTKMRERL